MGEVTPARRQLVADVRVASPGQDVIAGLGELTEGPGGRILGFIRQSGRGRQSDVPIVIHFFELFTIQGGKVRKLEYFRHRVEALEAAGLSE